MAGDTIRINQPSWIPYDLDSGGGGMYRDQGFSNYTVTPDWRITEELSLNVAHNRQETELEGPLISDYEPTIFGEANRTIGWRGPANPYAGRLYVDANWRSGLHEATYEETRLSLSYDLKTRWDWLGTHRIAGMLSLGEDTDRYVDRRLCLAGAPFNAAPDNQSNRVTQRLFLDESNPRSFIAPDWLSFFANWSSGTPGHRRRSILLRHLHP